MSTRRCKQITVILNAEEIGRLLMVSQTRRVSVPMILRSAVNYYLGRRFFDPEAGRFGAGGQPPRSRVRTIKQSTTPTAAQVVARLQPNGATLSTSIADQRSTKS